MGQRKRHVYTNSHSRHYSENSKPLVASILGIFCYRFYELTWGRDRNLNCIFPMQYRFYWRYNYQFKWNYYCFELGRGWIEIQRYVTMKDSRKKHTGVSKQIMSAWPSKLHQINFWHFFTAGLLYCKWRTKVDWCSMIIKLLSVEYLTVGLAFD